MPPLPPTAILFLQHGWADDDHEMRMLGQRLATPGMVVVAPCLNYVQTWLRIGPLIDQVEAIALDTATRYPTVPLRIVGHSMGGLIWLEILNRHPTWWPTVHSLVLIGSPVGGADLGRILDPFQMGLGIANDLGMNRKAIASHIAATIPTLTIAGDIDGGSDGTVPVAATRFPNAQSICLPGISHPALRSHPTVATTIQNFWAGLQVGEAIPFDAVIDRLQAVPGMTDGHLRDFFRATVRFHLRHGGTVRTWINGVGVHHVFVADAAGRCLYAGFVGWLHTHELEHQLNILQQDLNLASPAMASTALPQRPTVE